MGRISAAAVVLGLWAQSVAAGDLSPELQAPVRLEADGRPIDHAKPWGHAGPCVFDVDGDGRRDLVVGDFGGMFHLYRNVGADDAPRYESAGPLKAGSEPAKVWIYCCVASSPQFADLDGDGNVDLLSGSYDPGLCYWFPGNGDGTFRGRDGATLETLIPDPKALLEKDGAVRTESGANGLPLVDRSGRPILRVPDQKQVWESFGSWPYPVDWDADGDLDLVIGGFDGTIHLRENVGGPTKFEFAETARPLEAGGKPIGGGMLDVDSEERHAAVVAADWDLDGLFDLVSGFEDGSVRWFRNVGKPGVPSFAAAETLVPPADGTGFNKFLERGATPEPGIRTQVAVADMNGDDRPDLLVGDFSETYTVAELDAERRREFEAARERYTKAVAAYRDMNLSNYEKLDKIREQFPEEERGSDEVESKLRKEMEELRAAPEYTAAKQEYETSQTVLEAYLEKPESSRSFDEYATSHGFVWLYLRK